MKQRITKKRAKRPLWEWALYKRWLSLPRWEDLCYECLTPGSDATIYNLTLPERFKNV